MGKNHLTNENLNKKFDSPFNLVNYAIKLARARIAKGESYSSNVALDILDELEDEDESSEEILIEYEVID